MTVTDWPKEGGDKSKWIFFQLEAAMFKDLIDSFSHLLIQQIFTELY